MHKWKRLAKAFILLADWAIIVKLSDVFFIKREPFLIKFAHTAGIIYLRSIFDTDYYIGIKSPPPKKAQRDSVCVFQFFVVFFIISNEVD